jgi:hypothetical protein
LGRRRNKKDRISVTTEGSLYLYTRKEDANVTVSLAANVT